MQLTKSVILQHFTASLPSLNYSFERYIRICYYCQLRSTNLLTEENIKFYKASLVLFPILFYLPKWFEIR